MTKNYNPMNDCPKCEGVKSVRSTQCINCRFPKRWTVDQHGYVRRAAGRNAEFQHRMVMEEMLGRSLVKGENVHHINGVRDDNRPENLELWNTRQPAGQRPEDLVAYAREIFDLYGA